MCLGGGHCAIDGSSCDCGDAVDLDLCKAHLQYCDYNGRLDNHDQHLFCLNNGVCSTVEEGDGKQYVYLVIACHPN